MPTIKESDKDDIETLSELWYSLASSMEQYSELNKLKDTAKEDSSEGFSKLFEDEDTTIFLLETGKEAIGFMVLQEGEQPSRKHENYVSIVDLFVKEGYRSQGYGSEMIEKAEEYAEQQDCGYLKVSSEWENREARKFYQRNDFEEKKVEYTKKI
ncbi:GNAT family N-acetyltransferase [Candidatus Nanohalococcus occultus]|uniref:GNAT family N-acetyltransferase n=1 Tax=Candidatus Nanohalococcus occultus TaxID=2978047 RepID=UPI0039E13C8C